MNTKPTTITQFREALAAVDPAELTHADRMAVLELLRAAMAAAGAR